MFSLQRVAIFPAWEPYRFDLFDTIISLYYLQLLLYFFGVENEILFFTWTIITWTENRGFHRDFCFILFVMCAKGSQRAISSN